MGNDQELFVDNLIGNSILFYECPPLGTKGGGGATLACGGEGARGANSDDWRGSLALCLLCA
jgi:hypothetical protein